TPGLTGVGGVCDLQGDSDATIVKGLSSVGFFAGPVSSELTNAHISGTETFTAITDWYDFDNALRLWGRDGGYATPITRGACASSDSCRIWDWTLLPAGIPLHAIYGTFTSGAPCPASVQGDETFSYRARSNVDAYALRHAVEILGDWRGNENGLCDSHEACVFLPHLGANETTGALKDPCVFQDGVGAQAVVGVALHATR
ncbi:MAG: hypothetical protein JRH20_24400, partial [Deltaproteobacteria bacterium]|nr:hypothetical protein [Deltaproteobacteria bacterium]